jgi:hypothetical protein
VLSQCCYQLRKWKRESVITISQPGGNREWHFVHEETDIPFEELSGSKEWDTIQMTVKKL